MRRFVLLGFFWLVASLALKAQQSCEDKLIQAQEWLDQGRLKGIPALLHDCISKYSRQQKVQAYRILTMAYLYNDDPIGAERSFLDLLGVDPEYQILESDPIELEHLSAQYISTPIIGWQVMAGTNMSLIQVIHVNGIDNTDNSQQSYSPGFGFVANGSVDVHFSKNFSLMAGLELTSHKFGYSNLLFEDVNISGALSSIDYDKQDKTENHFAVGIPVSLKYAFNISANSGWSGYIYGGYKLSYATLNQANLTLQPGEVGGTLPPPVTGPRLNIDLLRTNFRHSALLGVGLMKRFGYKYGFIDIRYQAGLKNVLERKNQFNFATGNDESLNSSERFILNEYTFNYGMVDDDFRQSALYINVGMVFPMYRPRKANTVTIQSFFQELFTKKGKEVGDE